VRGAARKRGSSKPAARRKASSNSGEPTYRDPTLRISGSIQVAVKVR
jgi:hypothetical protein